MRDDVRQYLDALLESDRSAQHIAALAPSFLELDAGRKPARWWFYGSLAALEAAGELTAEEAADWRGRFPVGGQAEVTTGNSDAASRSRGESAERMQDGPLDRRLPRPEGRGEFVRTAVGPNESLEAAGGRFRVLGVDLHEAGFVVRWRLAPLPNWDELDASSSPPGWPKMFGSDTSISIGSGIAGRGPGGQNAGPRTIFDDRGVEYFAEGASAHGGSNELTGDVRCFPSVSEAARALLVEWQEGVLTVDLTTSANSTGS